MTRRVDSDTIIFCVAGFMSAVFETVLKALFGL